MGYLLTFGIVFDDNQRLISNNNSIYHTCKVVRFRYENETTIRKCRQSYAMTCLLVVGLTPVNIGWKTYGLDTKTASKVAYVNSQSS